MFIRKYTFWWNHIYLFKFFRDILKEKDNVIIDFDGIASTLATWIVDVNIRNSYAYLLRLLHGQTLGLKRLFAICNSIPLLRSNVRICSRTMHILNISYSVALKNLVYQCSSHNTAGTHIINLVHPILVELGIAKQRLLVSSQIFISIKLFRVLFTFPI